MIRSTTVPLSEHAPKVDQNAGLLVAADCLRTAVSDEDTEAVHAALCRARNALARCSIGIGGTSGTEHEALRVGTRHLLREVDALLSGVAASGGQCPCVTHAGPVVDQLIALCRLGGEVAPTTEFVGLVLRSGYDTRADGRN